MSDSGEYSNGSDRTVWAIIGCGNAKRDEPTEAVDLYTSNYFQLKREYADHFADRTIILSAKHGLLVGWKTTEPYDTTLGDRDRAVLVDEVRGNLRSPFTHHPWADEILLLAGKEYANIYHDALERDRDFGFEDIADGIEVVDVFAEADLDGIGEQMGWLRRAIDKDLRQPDNGADEQQTGLSRFAGRTEPAATDGGNRPLRPGTDRNGGFDNE